MPSYVLVFHFMPAKEESRKTRRISNVTVTVEVTRPNGCVEP